MRCTKLTALALLALTGLTGCGLASPGVGTPTPSPAIEEDEPGWDCHTMGNRICGATTDAEQVAGWLVWDYANGSRSLKVDPSRPYQVDYVGTSPNPVLSEGESAVVGKDFQWYVFRVEYTK